MVNGVRKIIQDLSRENEEAIYILPQALECELMK
jgi:hypothetical protein